MSTVAHEQLPADPVEYIVADDDEDEKDWVDYHPDAEPEPEFVYRQPLDVQETISRDWDDFRQAMLAHGWDRESLLEGVEKVYSTGEAAKFFGRSNQWLYWGLREGIFTYKDGTPILPERAENGRRRFTLPLIREIAKSCYRRGQIQETELEEVMAKVLLAQYGPQAFSDTAH